MTGIELESARLIQLSHITKVFGKVVALDDVSLDIQQGEMLALVGENGAGKSSLMNVLYGLYHPDQGELRIGGERVRLRGPKDAIARGIGMVHQHFMLVPTLTVAENVVLGREPTRRGLLDLKRAQQEVEATCKRFGFQLDPKARISELTVGSQQKVEIVKALHRGAQVLILDEPTAVLTPQEADELFRVARGLAAEGKTVVLISHKLKEVLAFAQRICVMRRGKMVASVASKDTDARRLADLMITGEEGGGAGARTLQATVEVPTAAPGAAAPIAAPAAEPILRLDGVCAGPKLTGATLEVRPGEIVGIAGVDGNGQRELAEVVTGLRPAERGELRLAGRSGKLDPHEARHRGVSHVPEDRLLHAIVGPMRVDENVSLGRQEQPPFAKGPWIDFTGRRERTESLAETYDVRPRDPSVPCGRLSGGNQQKVVFARELDAQPKLLVAVQPTRGLDIAAVAAVRRKLVEEKARGTGVLLVSLDLEEVLALSDRIYVMFEGKVVGERPRGADERELGALMLGGAAHG
ncbi:MAG TPA: ABC transporter ATP-binding protein [Myxococcaceae bacterium]|nr:ABC transporter ATP-binding protein [Myxococcaceae bacterium]